MNFQDIVEFRSKLQREVDRFFRGRIAVDERLAQTLQFTDTPNEFWPASSWTIFCSALRQQPSIGSVLVDCGFEISNIEIAPLTEYRPKYWHEDMLLQLEVWFRKIDIARRPPTVAYGQVRTKRSLSSGDVIMGALEARYLDDREGHRRCKAGKVSTNDLVGELARMKGIRGAMDVNQRLDEYTVDRMCEQLSERLTRIAHLDADAGRQQFLLYLDGDQVCIRPFGAWGAYQLQEKKLPDGSLWVARGNVIQPSVLFTPNAIAELEELINRNAAEQQFQIFFEQHPEFLLTLGDYKGLHPQLVLHEDTIKGLIPDFFLEKINSDFC